MLQFFTILTRLLPGFLLIASVSLTAPVSAQFNPTLGTSFDLLEAGLPSGFIQEAFFPEGDEGPSSLQVSFDRGSFSFSGYAPDQLVGGLVVDVFVSTPFVDIVGLIIAEVQVTSVGSDSMDAVAVVTEVTGNVAPGLALLGIPDPTGAVAFNVVYTDLPGDQGATMDVSDAGSLPLSGALGFDVPLTWTTPAILNHSPLGGELIVSTLLTSSGGTQSSFSETFTLIGGIEPPPPVSGLLCSGAGQSVNLSWNNPQVYDSIEVRRNGSFLTQLAGDLQSYLDPSPEPGSNLYEVIGISSGLPSLTSSCSAVVSIPTNRITVQSRAQAPGTPLDVGVDAELELDTEGYAFCLQYDPLLLQFDAATLEATAAADADFFVFDLDAPQGIASVAVLLDYADLVEIPAGVDIPICRFLGHILATAPTGVSTPLILPVAAGSPPLAATIVQNNGAAYAPLRNDGSVTIIASGGQQFIRGDANGDLLVDIADPVKLLGYLFASGSLPNCLDACDGNDDEILDVADAVQILEALFNGSGPLPAPGPTACGPDPTAGSRALGCDTSSCP